MYYNSKPIKCAKAQEENNTHMNRNTNYEKTNNLQNHHKKKKTTTLS